MTDKCYEKSRAFLARRNRTIKLTSGEKLIRPSQIPHRANMKISHIELRLKAEPSLAFQLLHNILTTASAHVPMQTTNPDLLRPPPILFKYDTKEGVCISICTTSTA